MWQAAWPSPCNRHSACAALRPVCPDDIRPLLPQKPHTEHCSEHTGKDALWLCRGLSCRQVYSWQYLTHPESQYPHQEAGDDSDKANLYPGNTPLPLYMAEKPWATVPTYRQPPDRHQSAYKLSYVNHQAPLSLTALCPPQENYSQEVRCPEVKPVYPQRLSYCVSDTRQEEKCR